MASVAASCAPSATTGTVRAPRRGGDDRDDRDDRDWGESDVRAVLRGPDGRGDRGRVAPEAMSAPLTPERVAEIRQRAREGVCTVYDQDVPDLLAAVDDQLDAWTARC